MLKITTSGSGQNRDELTRDQTYIALITEHFLKEENCLGEMRDAKAMNLPMYAIIKSGIKIPQLVRDMPWKKTFVFQRDDQIPIVAKLLKKEISK